jgi:hypothetical protein
MLGLRPIAIPKPKPKVITEPLGVPVETARYVRG